MKNYNKRLLLTTNLSFHHISAIFSLRCEIDKLHAVAILTSLEICSLHHCSFTYSFIRARLTLRSLFSLVQLKLEPVATLFNVRARQKTRTTVVTMLLWKKHLRVNTWKTAAFVNFQVLKLAGKLNLNWQLSRNLYGNLDWLSRTGLWCS